ncbi:hypothetical protein [Paenibacillus hamazuiensis]|uniref:hypothetical protein n=1 Tax=Paenibacillus hamazuiensis TaxID=2936508 RepID=UPI00200F8D77|nr:hypothetical protein [Paenibacillus hamazuiensis]
MKKRLFASLILAASIFLAALPVYAASSQYIDINEYSPSSVESRFHYGNHVYISVNNSAPTGNWGDINWELVDGYFNVIASGTVTNPLTPIGQPNSGDHYITFDMPLDGYNQHNAKLVLSCTSGRCQGDGYIETTD